MFKELLPTQEVVSKAREATILEKVIYKREPNKSTDFTQSKMRQLFYFCSSE